MVRNRLLILVMTVALFLAGGVASTAVAQSGGEIVRYTVGPPADFPESIVYDEGTNAFYGGSGGGPTSGALYKATLDDPTAELFLPPNQDGDGTIDLRTEAMGVTVDEEGRLYVAGGTTGRLFVYDLQTKELLARFETIDAVVDPRPPFINDVEVMENGDVYFTDSNRPFIFRVTEAQIEAGTVESPLALGQRAAEPIPLEPEVDYTPSGKTVNPLEANGIESTPDGRFLIFDSLNNQELYRLTPPPPGNPGAREITQIEVDGELGDTDGLQFLGDGLLVVDNRGEFIRRVELSNDFLTGRVVSEVTNPEFQTPTAVAPVPGNRLLVTNAEFFDGDRLEPFFVLSIPLGSLASDEGENTDDCTILGTEGDDVLTGTRGTDVMCGLGGNDTINGRKGGDTILGGEGEDTVKGGRGRDTIFGGEGEDSLSGVKGADFISGGLRDSSDSNGAAEGRDDGVSDTIRGGRGDDTCLGGSGDDRRSCS